MFRESSLTEKQLHSGKSCLFLESVKFLGEVAGWGGEGWCPHLLSNRVLSWGRQRAVVHFLIPNIFINVSSHTNVL